MIRRDSSIVTGANGYSLNPDYVKKVSWWKHDLFTSPDNLIAAELIAFKQLNPIIRSQGNKTQANEISNDEDFTNEMVQLFQGEPSGELNIIDTLTLNNLIGESIFANFENVKADNLSYNAKTGHL